MRIIDLHCDTILSCYEENQLLTVRSEGHISLDKLISGESLAQCFALFIPSNDALEHYHHFPDSDPWAIYHELLACYRHNMEACSARLRPAFTAEDVRNNAGAGFISAILTVEDGALTDGKTERIREMYDDGVRMLALTWNYENAIGYPNSMDDELHCKRGLKPFGFEAVSLMNDLGMIVDVSHLSEAGFYDVARASRKPFVASHSCCRALKDHSRNLTDDQLKVIGDCGGVVGINYYDVFLGDLGGHTTVEAVIAHMKHIADKAGLDALAFGSDFDGIESTLEFKDYSGCPLLLRALEKIYTPRQLDKICNENFLRVFGEQ